MHLQIIVGSIREGRTSMPVAEWALEQARQRGEVTVELVDLKEWDLPMLTFATPPVAMKSYEDPLQGRWAAKVAEADGFVFVSPEYNHGYSPALKNALDYVYREWNRKPAAFISFGGAFGARSVGQLRQVLGALQIAPLNAALHIREIGKKMDGGIFNGDEKDVKAFAGVLDELIWWTAALRTARHGT